MESDFTVLNADQNFLGIDSHCSWEEAEVAILPVPLELTTTYLKGTCQGPGALLQASHQVELYDDELKQESYKRGIATLAPMVFKNQNPEETVDSIQHRVRMIQSQGKKIVMIGGEHTITVGAVRAFAGLFSDLSVIHLDAHADLRNHYEGSALNHACVMARVRESCSFMSAGIRSLCLEESKLIEEESLHVFDIHRMRSGKDWMDQSLDRVSETVYLTIDLDVLDPSVMPAVGTPEPGGLMWPDILAYLRKIFMRKHVVGCDVVELSPRTGSEHGVFSAAKLVYRLIGYWFFLSYKQIP
jgi:agmatinase